MDYTVDYGKLAAEGTTAQGVADRMPAAVEPMRLDLVPMAIPGSLSAGRAAAADADLIAGGRVLTKGTSTYAEALQINAEEYRTTEERAERAIQEFFGGL